jgi:hypothetical protein
MTIACLGDRLSGCRTSSKRAEKANLQRQADELGFEDTPKEVANKIRVWG